jgi:serine/threonine protein kinase
MGAVYRGRHVLIRRPTAIKVLSEQNSSKTGVARFEREVNLTCRLNHPNTVQVFDYGRTPAGLFFYAMEYVDGITFEHLVHKHGPQPAGRVVNLIRQVCGSLVEAHEMGLVHRDIKPANLMLCRRAGVDDFVKVLDFGLARAVDRSQEAKLTIAGTVTGTPLFMSPEALQTPDQVDARTDLYSLGVVAYYLLTGTTPVEGATIVEICMKQVSAEIELPSKRLGRPVPDDVEAIVLRCLAKQPEYRFASAREVRQVLAKCASAAEWGDEEARAWWEEPSNKPSAEPAALAPSTKARVVDATYIFEPQLEVK